MQSGKLSNKKPILWVTGLFFLFAALRYLLSYITVNMPTIYIDEGLYINIARSLFYEGKVLYRAQPITYVYLGYPIVLMPLFLLPASVSLYRAAQVYNALLMSSAVFPAYLLGKKTGLTTNRAILLAVFTALIPEAALACCLTSESLYYPLMIWSFYLAARVTAGDGKKYSLILAMLTGLMYFIKPVCVIFGACFFAFEAIVSLKNGDKKNALFNAGAIGIIGAIIGIGYVVYNALFTSATVLNLYEKQFTETTAASIPVMLQAVLYHVMGFTLACGGGFMLLPWFSREKLDPGRKRLMTGIIIAILASIIGVAIAVVPYNYTGSGLVSPIHLRYLMFFFPAVFTFFLMEENDPARIRNKKAAVITLAVVTAFSVFPSAFKFFNNQAGTFDSPALNAFYKHKVGAWIGVVLIILSVNNAALTIGNMLKNKSKNRIVRSGCLMVVIFFIVNGACNYSARSTEDKQYERNATKLAAYLIDKDESLIVTNNRYDDFRSYFIDSHLRKPLKMAVMNDFLLNLEKNGGKYVPWTPVVQSPNTANEPTPDTDTLVFDFPTADFVEFTPSVQTYAISEPSGYVIATFDKNEPVLKTAIGAVYGYTLRSDTPGMLLVYDEEMRRQDTIKLYITMRSEEGNEAVVTFSAGGKSTDITVNGEWLEYEVTLNVPEGAAEMTTFDCSITADTDIGISEYRTETEQGEQNMKTEQALPMAIAQEDWADAKKFVNLATGIRMAYVEMGNPDGPAIILQHGMTDNSRSWSLSAPYFAEKGYHVYLPDLRGMGKSDAPDGHYTPVTYATDLAAFFDALGIEKAVVVGHSLGSYTMQAFSLMYPERVEKVVLVSSLPMKDYQNGALLAAYDKYIAPLPEDGHPSDAFMDAWYATTLHEEAFRDVFDVFLGYMKREAQVLEKRAWTNIFMGLAEGSIADRYGEIDHSIPVLILHGDADTMAETCYQQELCEIFQVPANSYRNYEGIGHNIHFEMPERCAKDILGWLETGSLPE